MRAAALYYDNNGSYGTVGLPSTAPATGPQMCIPLAGSIFADTNIQAMLTSNSLSNKTPRCGSSDSASAIPSWAVHITLLDGTNWCVDYRGVAKASTIATTPAGGEFKCQ